MHIFGQTDIGKVRKTNQDDFAYGLLPNGAAWAVVCDGMGGANGGSVASGMAVQMIADTVKNEYAGQADADSVRALLADALQKANRQVYERSLSDAALSGMGTTVVACVVAGNAAFIAHAGDSRAYLLRENAVQLTRDHSIVQELIESGQISAEEARSHPNRNIITRALGVEKTLDIDFGAHAFPPGTSILLCSDGLSNLVENEAFVQALRQGRDTAAAALISLANQKGGTDNITVVMIASDGDQE